MDIDELAKRLAPLLGKQLLQTPVVWGDARRIHNRSGVALNNTLFNTSSGDIHLEENVFFGHNVCLLTGTHDIRKRGRDRIGTYPRTGRDIVIRRGVWLASNVTVLGPCEIGADAVVAAGSLVLGDVPAGCLFGGCPARLIREIDFEN